MLDVLFGSASRARLLAVVLAEPRREYHLRELIRAVGGGASSVQRDVDRLEVLGLLRTRRTGDGRRMVAAAEDHPLLEPLRAVLAAAGAGSGPDAAPESAGAASSRVHPLLRPRLDAVIAALRTAGAEHAVLFGSATQVHDPAPPADLDVVVRLGGPGRGARRATSPCAARSRRPPASPSTCSRRRPSTTPTSAARSSARG